MSWIDIVFLDIYGAFGIGGWVDSNVSFGFIVIFARLDYLCEVVKGMFVLPFFLILFGIV